ncbi:MAG: type IX secretion system membrane protein PorP/SprF [Bacteroidota bacterium]
MKQIKHIILFGILFGAKSVYAQFEPQFTQYMFNEMFINPAYAGSRDHAAITGAYRNQWVGMDGAPKTQTFSGHTPLSNQKSAIGLSIMNDEISVIHDFYLFGTYAYHIQLPKGNFSMGLQGGLVNHQEKLGDIKTQDIGDITFLGTPKITVPNAGFGLYYNQPNAYVGLSIPRLITNKVDPGTGKALNHVNYENWHYYLMGGYVHPINDGLKIKATFMAKAVKGAPLSTDIGAHFLFNETIWIGANYRAKDSWAAIFSLQINKQLRLGYSFDYTISELKRVNSGTHEITIGYDFSFDKNNIVTPRYF